MDRREVANDAMAKFEHAGFARGFELGRRGATSDSATTQSPKVHESAAATWIRSPSARAEESSTHAY